MDDGFDVVGLQRPNNLYKKSQETFRLKKLEIFDQIDLQVVDLRDIKNVENIFKSYKPNYFAHLGSQSNVKKSSEIKELTKESNIEITKNIVDTIDQYSKDTIFFFPSSATIYEGYENIEVDEITKPLPKTEYAKSKLISQNYIFNKINENDLQLNTGIMFSHESEFRRSEFFTKKITKFLVDYKKNGNISLKVGNIFIDRDIGYAPEYVDAIYKIIKTNNRENYIVSSNKLNKLNEFINYCLEMLEIDYELLVDGKTVSYLDKKNNYEFISSEENEFRDYDLVGIKGNNNKILRDLNWSPKVGLNEISKIMVDYELKNKAI